MHIIRKCILLLVVNAILLVHISSCASNSSTVSITRASGLVQYPVNDHDRSQPRVYPNQGLYNQPQMGGGYNSHKFRIMLTRNISVNRDSDVLIAPEVSYFGVVGVGTPAKVFNVVFDTGSSEIWVPAYNWLPLANNLHYSDGYQYKESSTSVYLGREIQLSYRGTKFYGYNYDETFTLYQDAVKDDALVFASPEVKFPQNFLAIFNAEDEQFRYKPYDGVIGLAPIAQSSSGTRNLLVSLQRSLAPGLDDSQQQYLNEPQYSEHIGQQGYYPPQSQPYNSAPYYPSRGLPLSNMVFAFWFNPNQNSRHGGELMLGGIDENRFVGDMYFHKLLSWFDWQLGISSVMLGVQVVSCTGGCTASLDTGANSLVGPAGDVHEIYSALEATYHRDARLWLVDCGRIDSYPTLTFRVEDTPYMLMPRHYIKVFKHRDSLVCHLAIKPWDKPGWLLGTSFIGAYYTVFDFGNRQIGFASSR